ncbi:MAG: hypothetical protein IPL65_22370 [Lewinellaceae bacterium]|nr:hypothetical protein [Lewinellaceae bacterium]
MVPFEDGVNPFPLNNGLMLTTGDYYHCEFPNEDLDAGPWLTNFPPDYLLSFPGITMVHDPFILEVTFKPIVKDCD